MVYVLQYITLGSMLYIINLDFFKLLNMQLKVGYIGNASLQHLIIIVLYTLYNAVDIIIY